jgi:hypothetical protein
MGFAKCVLGLEKEDSKQRKVNHFPPQRSNGMDKPEPKLK